MRKFRKKDIDQSNLSWEKIDSDFVGVWLITFHICNLYIHYTGSLHSSTYSQPFESLFPSSLKGSNKASTQNLSYFINACTYASSITASNAALVRDLSLTATGYCTWSRERVWNISAKSPRCPTAAASAIALVNATG